MLPRMLCYKMLFLFLFLQSYATLFERKTIQTMRMRTSITILALDTGRRELRKKKKRRRRRSMSWSWSMKLLINQRRSSALQFRALWKVRHASDAKPMKKWSWARLKLFGIARVRVTLATTVGRRTSDDLRVTNCSCPCHTCTRNASKFEPSLTKALNTEQWIWAASSQFQLLPLSDSDAYQKMVGKGSQRKSSTHSSDDDDLDLLLSGPGVRSSWVAAFWGFIFQGWLPV